MRPLSARRTYIAKMNIEIDDFDEEYRIASNYNNLLLKAEKTEADKANILKYKDCYKDIINLKTTFDNINKKRSNKIRYIQCFYCGKYNRHISSKCPEKFCIKCKEHGHTIRACPKKNFCQLCGSLEHNTKRCPKNQDLLELRYIRCHMCGRFGHIASDCFFPFRRYINYNNNNNWNYRFNRRYNNNNYGNLNFNYRFRNYNNNNNYRGNNYGYNRRRNYYYNNYN